MASLPFFNAQPPLPDALASAHTVADLQANQALLQVDVPPGQRQQLCLPSARGQGEDEQGVQVGIATDFAGRHQPLLLPVIEEPQSPPGRVRFLDDGEKQRLMAACKVSRNPHLYPLLILALSTGARKTELLTLTWGHVDLEQGLIRLEVTKNKERRTLPVTGLALNLLKQHRSSQRWGDTGWVFPRADGQGPTRVDVAWTYACRRAGVDNFRFHDLRHTAASYLVMEGASLIEVAEILGHKTLQMVKRYSHISAHHTEKIATKLTTRLFGDMVPKPEGGNHAEEV